MRIISHLRTQVYASAPARQAEVQSAPLFPQEEHAALRVGKLERGIYQRSQYFFEGGRAGKNLSHLQQQPQMLELLVSRL